MGVNKGRRRFDDAFGAIQRLLLLLLLLLLLIMMMLVLVVSGWGRIELAQDATQLGAFRNPTRMVLVARSAHLPAFCAK